MNKITETEFKTLVNRFNRSARAEERISELDDKIKKNYPEYSTER